MIRSNKTIRSSIISGGNEKIVLVQKTASLGYTQRAEYICETKRPTEVRIKEHEIASVRYELAK